MNNNRPLSSLRLAFLFAGCFLGAGYVSGRELRQFFGRFGAWGWFGLGLAMLCLALLGALTLTLVRRANTQALEELVIPWNSPVLRRAVAVFSIVFLLGIDCVMTAGVGAIFAQLFSIPPLWSSLLFSLVVALFTLTGLRGLLNAFSATVPFLTAAAVVLSLLALLLLPGRTEPAPAQGPAWAFAALAFASYNMFGSVAILAPFGPGLSAKTVRRGVALGAGLLLIIAGLFLFVMHRHPEAAALELPMLEIVRALSPALSLLFALLLLLAMFGTAFSSFLTGFNQLAGLFGFFLRHRVSCIFGLSALLWGGSLWGFGSLIDVVYPAFGAISVVFLLGMIAHYFMLRRREKSQ